MLSFASRHCWMVLPTRVHLRFFALVAGARVFGEELQRLVDEARRQRKPGPRRAQAPGRSQQGEESRAGADHASALRRTVQNFMCTAQARSQRRGTTCELDVDFLFDIILQQQGKCAYSDVDMELIVPHSHWRMSLERIDPMRGYLRNNVVLIAQEFNSMVIVSKKAMLQGSSQWSKEKVERLPLEIQSIVNLQNLRRHIELATTSQNICASSPEWFLQGEGHSKRGHLQCAKCERWKPEKEFSPHVAIRRGIRLFSCYCEQCLHQFTWTKSKKTVRGCIRGMFYSARRRHAIHRWQGDFDLDVDSVLRMLWSQQGRCFYSGVPLRYAQSNVDWQMSLERLDTTQTYTKENTRLVALEFNTRNQWSQEKVQFVWGPWLEDGYKPSKAESSSNSLNPLLQV